MLLQVLEENNSENPDVTNERLATPRPSTSIEDVDFANNALSSNVEEIKTEENEQEGDYNFKSLLNFRIMEAVSFQVSPTPLYMLISAKV